MEHGVRVAAERQREMQARAAAGSGGSASSIQLAVITGGAFAIPAALAWGVAGVVLAGILGGVIWFFDRGRRRAMQREYLSQLWVTIEDASGLDDVRRAAANAIKDLDGVAPRRLPQR